MSKILGISKDLSLPVDAVTSTLVVYGGKGMGKTNFGGVLVEELSSAGLRWAVLDPVGVWWGIRHSKEGHGPGVECLILGGVHGDIPIEPTGGAIVADLVVDEAVNVIIDFSRKPNGEMWGVGEKIRFVHDYGRRLFQRQGSLVEGKRREPLFQLMDEAARFVPQMIRAGQPDLAMCLSVWAQIAEEGRNVGLGVGFISQRSARLNKDVAELADAMFAFRTVGPNSLQAVVDWLGSHVPKERINNFKERVRSLPRGECLVVSPGWLQIENVVLIRQRQTFDSSATPKSGESGRRVLGDGARPDLKKYAERMRETIERARDNDPKHLKQRIAELEKQARAVRPAETVKVEKVIETKVVEVPAITPELVDALKGVLSEMSYLCDELRRQVTAAMAPRPVSGRYQENRPVDHANKETAASAPPAKVKSRPATVAESNGHLAAGELKVLTAVAQFGGVTREQLGVLTGYKATSRKAYLRRLRQKGYLAGSGETILATVEGISALGADYEPLPRGEELREHWMNRLPEGEKRVLQVLLDWSSAPWVPYARIEQETGYKPTSRKAYLRRLAARCLVVTDGRGQARVAEELF